MKKTSAAAALAAAGGLSALAATPSLAMSPPSSFDNCTEANNAGYSNITADSPYYGAHLDDDMDGVGCEDDTWVAPVAEEPVAEDWSATEWGTSEEDCWDAWDPSWSYEGESGEHVIIDWVSPEMEANAGGMGAGGQQVSQMPVGGADTGVAQTSDGGDGALVIGGGLALIAAAGTVYVVRRRSAEA